MSGEPVTPINTRNKKYEVFIVHKTEEDEHIAHKVQGVLEEKSLKVLPMSEAVPAGQCKYDSIVKCVHNSARTAIILTSKSLENPLVLLETVQAIEQSQESGTLTLRLLVNNVKDEELKFLKRGILATVPHYRLNFDEENWEEMLVKNITSEVQLADILPLEGSMAHGLVFSHYVGFLSYVLPMLKEMIEGIKIFKDNPGRVSRKYYILFPKSCKVPGSLESYDGEKQIYIRKKEEITFKKQLADKLRTVKLAIYEITKKSESGDESYFFFADCPYILNAMYVMKNAGLKEVDIRHQLAQLRHLLGDVINHAENNDCFGTVKLITHDENEETVQTAIYRAVTESMEAELIEDEHKHDKDGSAMQGSFEESEACSENDLHADSGILANGTTDDEYEVAINYLQDLKEDYKVATELERFFEGKQVKMYTDKGTETELSVRPGKCQVFVLSKQTVTRPNPLIHRCSCALEKGLMTNGLHVLLVLVDIEPKDLPGYIKWVTVVMTSEPKYCEKLLMTIKGGIVRMEQRLPTGDVATGLAWAYVINYLKITLLGKDLRSRIKKFLQEKKIDCGCIVKMFPVLPKSCTLEEFLEKKAKEGLKDNMVFEYMGKLDPVIADTGCQTGRPFYLHVYKITKEQESVCFIAEYFTPGNCLHGMAYSYPFSGLHTDDMKAQGRRTVELVQDILQLSTVKQKLGDMSNLVEIIYYNDDDKQVSLMSTLYQTILEKKDKQTIVSA